MAGQKFFHGLTDAMINRATADRPDRQKSNFYWPDEYLQDPQETFRTSNGGSGASSRRPSTTSSSATTTPKECMSPIGGQDSAEVLKQRHRSNARSHIEFYDDCDSSFSALEREKQRAKLGIEKFLREQDEDVSEAAKTRRQNTLKSKIQFYDYEEPQQTPNRTPSRQQQSNGHHHPASTPVDYPEDPRFSPTHNGTPSHTVSLRRQQSSPASSEYHYSARYTGSYDDFEDDRFSCKSNDYGFSPPGTPLSGEIPEHKRNSQRHLRSSIAFCNGVAIAEDSSAQRKPVSVRDAASAQRVGVGLPNL